MIHETPSLDAREVAVLARVAELRDELQHSLHQRPAKWTGLLARTLRAKAIRGSNSIEGYVVSEEAALAALDGDRPEDTEETSWVNVVHYREAMDYVLQLMNDPAFHYTPQILKALHFVMLRHRHDKHPGLWRPGAVFVRNDATGETVYTGPSAERVPRLVEELCTELGRDAGTGHHALIRGAMAHLNLVMIHPFSDGNGRMARCLQTLVLARSGLADPAFSSIEEYLGRNTQDYYRVLAEVGRGEWNPERGARPWIRFCLTAHFRQARSVKRRLDSVAAIADDVERELERRSLPLRSAVSLVNSAFGYRIKNESYRREADVSQASATRDLRQLSEAGLIIADGEKRGRHYSAGEWLAGIAEKHRDRSPIADPFEDEP